jgi:NADH-quinone oxidoreductase subunit H
MFLVSGLAAILFFGGWHGPIPIAGFVSTTFVNVVTLGNGESFVGLSTYLANFMGCVNFIFKGFVGMTVMMWIRWTLPRLRIDQVMTTCLKYCVPLAAFFFLGAMFWQLFDFPTGPDLTGFNRGSQTELWVETADRDHPQADPVEDASAEAVPSEEEPADSADPLEAGDDTAQAGDARPTDRDRVFADDTGGPPEKGGAG